MLNDIQYLHYSVVYLSTHWKKTISILNDRIKLFFHENWNQPMRKQVLHDHVYLYLSDHTYSILNLSSPIDIKCTLADSCSYHSITFHPFVSSSTSLRIFTLWSNNTEKEFTVEQEKFRRDCLLTISIPRLGVLIALEQWTLTSFYTDYFYFLKYKKLYL